MSEVDESITLIQDGGGDARAAVELARGTVLAGRYEIERVLGRGGMGVVLRAYDRVLAETIAIKVLHPEYARQRRWVDRLGREVKLARKIQHPNVCRVYDFAEADGHTFITMELAANGTLRDVIDAALTRPIADRLADAKAVAAGLAAIHDAGIVHRDVTPQNVLRMADGRLAVSDFGLATEVSGSTTSIHGGTLAYMAPEVLRGAKGERASDIWSLGVVIHEVVFGRRPEWEGRVSISSVRGFGGQRPTAAERAVLQVCAVCMKVRPHGRFASAREVARRLSKVSDAGRVEVWPTAGTRALIICLVFSLVGVATYRATMHRSPEGASSAHGAGVSGTMEDWSVSSKVLAAGSGRIVCLSILPGGRTARIVWETPRRAEDIDIQTGLRRSSSLREETYRSSCPQLSPDGNDLIYDGFDDAGRAHVFLARPDGSSAKPLVRCNEPSMGSEPLWLGSRKEFIFDVDGRYAGIFSLAGRKTIIVPGGGEGEIAGGFFKAVSADGSRIAIVEVLLPHRSRLKVFAFPEMRPLFDQALDALTQDWRFGNDGKALWMSFARRENIDPVVARIDPPSREVHSVAHFPETSLFHYTPLPDRGALFEARRYSTTIWISQPGEDPRPIVGGRDDFSPSISADGRILVTTYVDGKHVIAFFERAGGTKIVLTDGPEDGFPAFLPDGKEWIFLRQGGAPGLYRCSLPARCRRISEENGFNTDVSSDGARVAYLVTRPRGAQVRIMDLRTMEQRDLAEADSYCPPVWAGADHVWVSRREGDMTAWTRVDVHTGAVVERWPLVKGNCMRGDANIEFPVKRKIWSKLTIDSELRWRSEGQ